MERFLTNYRPKPKPKETTPVTVSSAERNRQYDQSKRKRVFVESWKRDFPWLKESAVVDVYANYAKTVITFLNSESPHDLFLTCEVCRKYTPELQPTPTEEVFKSKPFLYGCQTYRKSSLESHQKSAVHRSYIERDCRENANSVCHIKQAFTSLERSHLEILFRNSYGVLKTGRPWTDYEFLCRLDSVKGLNIGKTYLNRNSGKLFGRYIALVLLKEIEQLFRKAKYFAVVLDEATDISHKEQVILYIRFSVDGQIYTKYCALFTVTRATSRQIVDGLLDSLRRRLSWDYNSIDLQNFRALEATERATASQSLITDTFSDSSRDTDPVFVSDNQESNDNQTNTHQDLGSSDFIIHSDESESDSDESTDSESDCSSSVTISQHSVFDSETKHKPALLIGMTSDGASVLSGKRSGVRALLQQEVNSHIQYIWCISHRLQLAIKDALKRGCTLFNHLTDFFQSLYKFHRDSNVVSATYRNCVQVSGLSTASAVIRVDGTRWIHHMYKAVTNFLNGIHCHMNCLSALLAAENFSPAQKAKANYFLKKLTDNVFVEFVIFMVDVLRVLSLFSLCSQTKNITMTSVELSLAKCNEHLLLLKQHAGTEFEKYHKSDFDEKLSQCQIKNPEQHLTENVKHKVIDSLIDCISERCSNSFPQECEVLNSLVDPSLWKKEKLFTLESTSSNGIKQWKSTEWLDLEVRSLKDKQWIKLQLEYHGVVVEDILAEWRLFKVQLPKYSLVWDSSLTWSKLLDVIPSKNFENLVALVDFLSTFGISSADAERGFSCLKNTKTSKRSVLGQKSIEDQLLVRCEGVALEKYDPSKAIEAWTRGDLSNRKTQVKRPTFMDRNLNSVFGPKPKKTKHQ